MNKTEEKYRLLAQQGLSKTDAAQELGVSHQAVSCAAKKYGIIFNDGRKRPDKDKIFEMHMSGMTASDIAMAIGDSSGSVSKFLLYYQIEPNKEVKKRKYTSPYPDPKDKRKFSPEYIRGIFGYCPKSGIVRRLDSGKPVGSVDCNGYLAIYHKGFNLRAHRVAWVCHYGGWPDNVINHKNGVKTDNRIDNLEDVTQSENAKHALKMKKAREVS